MKKDSVEIYNQKVEDIFKNLNTDINGLTEEEANKRLLRDGENKLREKKKKSSILIYLEQYKDFMVILLILAVIFSAFVSYFRHESYADSIIIMVIVVINSLLSFIQEKKADAAIEELNKLFVTNTSVIRNKQKKIIDVRHVVVGDIIELEGGDYIPADARIISSDELMVNESTLTGESKAVRKEAINITSKKELFERKNMVYAGCTVSNGHAFAVVTSTGTNTELGKIADSLINNRDELTPLQKRVNQIGHVLSCIVISIIIIMMIVGVYMGKDLVDVLTLSISLAVAAIPEGLSSVITIILSLGMSQMARKNVIIRKMSSVETLGSTDVICSDKTGTITQNKMTVKKMYVNDKIYDVDDDIEGEELLITCASLNHNVTKTGENYIGDETEIAIYKFLEEKGYLGNVSSTRVKEYPFDSERKMMSTINTLDEKVYSFTKGGLDSVISHCSSYVSNDKVSKINDEFKQKIYKIEKELSAKSLRLIAFAYKNKDIEKPEEDMIFIGLIGMMDPPRETVPYAIKTCLKSGIKPIMITGDSINTATAIAKEVGIISSDDKSIEGKEIDKMNDKELAEAVNKYQVYARISPNTKLRIVESLQKQGLVVAMTGDGVNDAPAIQKADIGIGMGITGTEVVKKVADCILVDDSFSTIVDGVEEGRRITSNIKKVLLYLLAGNIVEVILVFISLLMDMEMFTTLQLLWINLITDSIPAITLAFEKSEKEIMENTVANKNSRSFFTPFISAKILYGAIFKSLVMILTFTHFAVSRGLAEAGSLMFIFLISHELLYAFSCRNLKHSVLNYKIFENKRLTIGVSLITLIQILVLTTGLNKYFIVPGIILKDVFIVLLISLAMFTIGELVKPIYRKLFKDY